MESKKIVEKFLNGQGIDTSIHRILHLKNTEHLLKEYNNVYTVSPKIAFESIDFVYNENSINKTKFPIILLTEWSKYLKVGGFLILLFEDNKILNFKKVKKIYEQFLQRNMDIEYEEKSGKSNILIFKKNKKFLEKNTDSITEWTFGMITVGKRNEWVRQFIDSVRAQNIPNYEIIIVGTWDDPTVDKKDIKYIQFNQKDDLGWITKKKNLIFENAKYNNVLVLHDRFFLDKNWYDGMKKYGNLWEGLFFPIIDKTEHEYVHWSVWGHGFLPIGYADMRDWGEDYYTGGTFMAIKKNIWEQVKLDENLFWGDQEDAEYGLRFTEKGFIMRPNPDSKLHTTVTYINDAPIYAYDNQKLGKAIEYRGKKWIVIQRIIDILTRNFGLTFLRTRKKISKLLKKYTTFSKIPEAGGKRK